MAFSTSPWYMAQLALYYGILHNFDGILHNCQVIWSNIVLNAILVILRHCKSIWHNTAIHGATMQRANITSFKKFLDQNLSIKIKSLADVTFDCLERHQPPVKYISYIIKFLRRCKNLKQGGFVPLPP